MLSVLRRNIALLLAILTFIAALFFTFGADKSSKSVYENNYLSFIETKVSEENANSINDLALITAEIKQHSSFQFDAFSTQTVYPYLVFEEGNSVFWSTSSFLPSYAELTSAKNSIYLETTTGSFLVNKQILNHAGHSFEIFSVIILYQNFQNENEYLRSNYNETIFSNDPLNLSRSVLQSKDRLLVKNKGKAIFSVSPPSSESLQSRSITQTSVIFTSLALLFLGIWLFQIGKKLYFEKKFLATYFILGSFLVLVRVFMLYFSLPFVLNEANIFNPKFYALSQVNPSIGDVFLNILFALVFMVYVLCTYVYSQAMKQFLRASKIVQILVSVLSVLLGYLLFGYFFNIISSFYRQSKDLFNLGLNIHFDAFRVITIVVSIILTGLYFGWNHIFVNFFIRSKLKIKAIIFSFATLVGIAVFSFLYGFQWVVLLVPAYWLMVIGPKFYKSLGLFSYKTTIYFFSAAFVAALMMFFIHQNELENRDFIEKQKIGERYLNENDLFTEGLLAKSIATISVDTSISLAVKNQIFAREKVKQIVLEKHLDSYLDNYDTEVLLFDESGVTFDNTPEAKNLDYFTKNFQRENFKTQIKDVYFINEADRELAKQYVSFIQILQDGRLVGHVVLDMKLEGETSQGIYPDLLKNRKGFQDINQREYSFAIYQNGILKQNLGFFNYGKRFSRANLSNNDLFEKGLVESEFSHVGLKNQKGRSIIVSSKVRPWQEIVADFSFQFMMLVIGVILVIILYSLRYGFSGINLNFATKIQIYLNASFLLPLILVILITLSVVSATFVSNQGKSYLDITQNISQNIKSSLLRYNQGTESLGILSQDLNRTAREAKVDINLYDAKGLLIASTKPLIFENNLLSKFLNPLAYSSILEEKEGESLQTENIGSLSFNTSFVGINDKANKPVGVIAIPFFDSKSTIESQISNVVSSILSVFTLIFISLLIISYFTSNALTVPLKLITQKIKKIDLDKPNERLVWNTNDEIGMMMGEYNKMLLKLEESKEALALSEKQTAWREMAKQVAHEIKNPLTPMKLSVQQLQRTLTITEDVRTRDRIERALNSLIEQIDNISDIAQSFSDFAKMPVPRTEVFDLAAVVQKCADLYAGDERISLNAYIRLDKAAVVGDRQLMSRIITNLIINGVQSVPASRKPIINLRLYKADTENVFIVEVQDNGNGIPESLRNKIFVPNFSTKAGGSGLGLAMAKRGIEHANGNLWFESVTSKGTTFFLDLPLVDEQTLLKS